MEFSGVNAKVSKHQGNVGVAKAIYELTKRGHTVLLPFTDSDKYDLVVDMDGRLFKVQAKTSRCKSASGGFAVNLKTSGGNTKTNTIRRRQENDYDLLFVLVDTGQCWLIPVDHIGAAGASIVVGVKKYNEFLLG